MFEPSLHLEGEQSQAQVSVFFLELDSAFAGKSICCAVADGVISIISPNFQKTPDTDDPS
jgi:hypothetical protein